jgi:hypothetical protein
MSKLFVQPSFNNISKVGFNNYLNGVIEIREIKSSYLDRLMHFDAYCLYRWKR